MGNIQFEALQTAANTLLVEQQSAPSAADQEKAILVQAFAQAIQDAASRISNAVAAGEGNGEASNMDYGSPRFYFLQNLYSELKKSVSSLPDPDPLKEFVDEQYDIFNNNQTINSALGSLQDDYGSLDDDESRGGVIHGPNVARDRHSIEVDKAELGSLQSIAVSNSDNAIRGFETLSQNMAQRASESRSNLQTLNTYLEGIIKSYQPDASGA